MDKTPVSSFSGDKAGKKIKKLRKENKVLSNEIYELINIIQDLFDEVDVLIDQEHVLYNALGDRDQEIGELSDDVAILTTELRRLFPGSDEDILSAVLGWVTAHSVAGSRKGSA